MVYCSHKFLRTCVRARFPKEDDAPMTRRISLRRLVAALLALVLVLSLTPAALASASCPQCGGETLCTDNGDGRTHTVSCPEDGYSDLAAPHDFTDNGRCSACGAIDYSKVHITLPSDTAFTAAMGDSDAAISLDGVTLTLGKNNEDVTGEYTLSYSWYYNGTSISTGQRCPLPPSVTSKEGDYSFVCFVTAVPGNAVAGKTISASCTVKVHVQDLLSAAAVIGSRDLYLSLGADTGRTPVSVADQIIQAVKDAGGEATYVVFDKKPSSAAGDLKVTPGERYSLADGEGTPLTQVRFEPDSAGAYAIGFTAYDQEGTAYPGLLTIAVEQDLGSVDVLYTTVKGDSVTLSAQDFAAFWQTAYPRGKLTLVRFTSLPAASSGTLRQGYLSAARPGTPVSEDESCYASAGESDHALLDEVAFVPDSRFTGSVSIPFEAYGSDGNGNQVYRSGRLFLFVNPKEVQAVSCPVAEDSSTKLSAGDFQTVYHDVTGNRGSGFYIRFLEVPAAGDLYANNGATRLTAASIGEKAFSYQSISSLSYTAGTADSSVRYAAYNTAGELLYVGSIVFSVQEDGKVPFTDVKPGSWFYSYVADLAEAGIITGTSATTYSPNSNVTWGEALKLVLLATGVDEQPSDGSHWASGYLKYAISHGLLEKTVPLRQEITRGELAELAAAAMKLKLPTRIKESPFQDVPTTSSSAAAIVALYEAGIVEGTTLSNGQALYHPDAPLRRSEIAAIIWRIQQAAEKD